MPDEPVNDTTVNPPDDSIGADEQSAVDEDQGELQDLQQEDPDERILNKMRSWIGRRDKEMEERLISQVGNVVSRMLPQQPPPQMQQQPGFNAREQDDPEPDVFTQPKEWFRWEQRQQVRHQTTAKQQAESVYFNTLTNPTIRHSDEKIHEAVMKELSATGHMNNIDPVTGHPMGPSVDAMLNYNRALRTVMEKRIGQAPENPLQQNQPPKAGLGVSQPGAQQGQQSVNMPRNLSPYAQKLVRHAGWNAEKVRTVLGK